MGLNPGDLHNFGRRVELSARETVLKPRNLLCEYLFLSTESELRRELNALFHVIVPGKSLVPGLHFYQAELSKPTLHQGEVEFLMVDPTEEFGSGDLLQIGAIISVFLWAGLTDNTAENMVLGRRRGEFIFSGLDWETCFTKLKNPWESGLFKSMIDVDKSYEFRNVFGLSLLIPFLSHLPENFVTTILDGHLRMTKLLLAHQDRLHKILQRLIKNHCLVRRVILRPSYEYFGIPSSELIDEERVQMSRGDIPYFFQKDQDPRIYYWSSEEEYKEIERKPEVFLGEFRWPEYPENFLNDALVGISRSLDRKPGENYTVMAPDVKVYYKGTKVLIEYDGKLATGHRLNQP